MKTQCLQIAIKGSTVIRGVPVPGFILCIVLITVWNYFIACSLVRCLSPTIEIVVSIRTGAFCFAYCCLPKAQEQAGMSMGIDSLICWIWVRRSSRLQENSQSPLSVQWNSWQSRFLNSVSCSVEQEGVMGGWAFLLLSEWGHPSRTSVVFVWLFVLKMSLPAKYHIYLIQVYIQQHCWNK